MNRTNIYVLTALAVICVTAGAGAARKAVRVTATGAGRPTHVQQTRGVVYEPNAELLRDLRKKVRVAQSKKDWKEFNRQSPVANAPQTRTAYTASFAIQAGGDAMVEVVVVHDAKTDTFYEVRGLDDFPWRPFSDLKWVSEDVLQFDQWVNPGNGGRYRVDLKSGTIVAAGYVRDR